MLKQIQNSWGQVCQDCGPRPEPHLQPMLHVADLGLCHRYGPVLVFLFADRLYCTAGDAGFAGLGAQIWGMYSWTFNGGNPKPMIRLSHFDADLREGSRK